MKKIVFFIALVIIFSTQHVLAEVTVTASSSEKDSTLPENVFDLNFNTRWSSNFSDPQWLMIDLEETKEVSGLILYWENAHASSYEILLSEDGDTWKSVYGTKTSDGETDDIYFTTTPTRFIKILGKKRATSWGYSLWEVVLKGKEEEPIVDASSFVESGLPANIMDGNLTTSWQSASGNEEWLEIDLKIEKILGGLELRWGEDYAVNYEILTSLDRENWQTVYKASKSNGGKDLIYLDRPRARFIKLVCQKGNLGSYSLKELSLKGKDEHATPERFYQIMAEESPEGFFPDWIYKKQVYWTVVGIEDDITETLFEAKGGIEPYKGSFSLMPYLFIDGKLITAYDCELTHFLEEGYLPIPSLIWNYDGIELEQKVFNWGEKGKSLTYIWYTLKNNRPQEITGKLFLSVRPLQINPPWQYGGLSKIQNLDFQEQEDNSFIKINNKIFLILLSQPDAFGAVIFKKGDIISFLSEGNLPQNQSVKDNEGFASGAVEFSFELEPETQEEFFFILPLGKEENLEKFKYHSAKRKFKKAYKETVKSWKKKLNKIKIDIPNEEIANVLRANLAYLLINRDNVALHPGPRNYDRSWIRDGAVMSASLLRTGHFKEAKEYLDWVASCQMASGEIPCMLEANGQLPGWASDWVEHDGQGAYVFAISDYYRFSKDKEFLEEKFPSVLKALGFLENIRKKRLTPRFEGTVFYGILPESNSHEGYFPAQHSLWDDFWALGGWKQGQYLAKVLGKDDLIGWMKKEETELRENLIKNIKLLQEKRKIKYIPGCFEKADFDATSTAISVWPTGEAQYLPQESLTYTFDEYYRSTFSPRLKVGLRASYTPYEIRTATAYLMLGEKEKALTMLNYFLKDMRPLGWKHWAEVVHDVYDRPQYIGDMPHTWIGAIAMNLIRSLFVFEEEEDLVLAAGIDWGSLGEDNEISIEDFPTQFGEVNYSIKKKDSQIKVKVWGKAQPKKFIFRLPPSEKLEKIEVNGEELLPCEEVVFDNVPALIKITLK